MLTITETSSFKRDKRKAKKRGLALEKLSSVVYKLQIREPLPTTYRDHALLGNWSGFRECHIEPDWLLIYRIDDNQNLLILVRTGTHVDLFE